MTFGNIICTFILITCVGLWFISTLKLKLLFLSLITVFNIITLCFSVFWLSELDVPEYIINLIFVCFYLWNFGLVCLFSIFEETITKDLETYYNITRRLAVLVTMSEEYADLIKKSSSDLTFDESVIVYTICNLLQNYDKLRREASNFHSKCNGFFRVKWLSCRFADKNRFDLLCRANYWYEEYGNQKPNIPDLDKYYVPSINEKIYNAHDMF